MNKIYIHIYISNMCVHIYTNVTYSIQQYSPRCFIKLTTWRVLCLHACMWPCWGTTYDQVSVVDGFFWSLMTFGSDENLFWSMWWWFGYSSKAISIYINTKLSFNPTRTNLIFTKQNLSCFETNVTIFFPY